MLSGSWIGNLNGTLIGNLYAEFAQSDDRIGLTLRANINSQAIVLTGPVIDENDTTVAQLVSRDPETGEELSVRLVFDEIADDRISGRWLTQNDHAGSFALGPATNRQRNSPAQANGNQDGNSDALKIVRRAASFPKITIYRDEIQQLAKLIKNLVDTPHRVVIHAGTAKKDLRKFDPEFWEDPSLIENVDFLYLTLIEQENLRRSVEVNLSDTGCSVSVTGSDEVWVAGCYYELEQYFSSKNTWLKSFYERHALNFNGLAFVTTVTLMPSLELIPRAFLMSSTIISILIFKIIHMKTTSLRIFLTKDKSETKLIDVPRLFNTLLGTGVVAFVPLAYAWLSGNGLQNALDWLSKLAAQN